VAQLTKSRLHITNGDGAANLLKASSVGGDVLPWRDPMHHGPFPSDLDIDAVSKVRARYLAGPKLTDDDVVRDFTLRNEHLKAFKRYQEVVLWFEHDLLDQLQILQLLDWFRTAEFDPDTLALICIDRFEGFEPFRGLGELSPAQMSSLLECRQPVTEAQLQLATDGWCAFRSPDPRDLEGFIAGELEPLPFLRGALMRHLEEYPWLCDGLTRTERQLLALVAHGTSAPGNLFFENMGLETALFMGDLLTFRNIANLCGARIPLLLCEPKGEFVYPPDMTISRDEFRQQRLSVTETGERILSGDIDARDAVERDFWLGGVHINSRQTMWMWDHNDQRLKATSG